MGGLIIIGILIVIAIGINIKEHIDKNHKYGE